MSSFPQLYLISSGICGTSRSGSSESWPFSSDALKLTMAAWIVVQPRYTAALITADSVSTSTLADFSAMMPSSHDVDGVLLEGVRLEQLAQVLDRGADLSEDEELLERAHERAARLLARRRVGEDMTKLRVGVLVHAAVGDD